MAGRDGNARTSGHATSIKTLASAITLTSGTRSNTGTKTDVREYDKFVCTLSYGSWVGSGNMALSLYACADTDGTAPVKIGSSGNVKSATTAHMNIPLLANWQNGAHFVYSHITLGASSQGKATVRFYAKA